ncbi:hypothetical protein O0L34_g6731 [Tuta absoluta]|nr:hypothetical protein O0L34_g6731 [Tuta absoluta]
MEKRQEKLSELQNYIAGVDKEITMILQSLQWDRKHLLESDSLVPCSYDAGHRVPPDKRGAHEETCLLRRQGYAADDRMLPETLDDRAPTVVTFSKEEITQIVNQAAQSDPSFKRGPGSTEHPPLTAERLQASWTADERRAIYDAVVSAAPDDQNVEDLAIPGADGEVKQRPKSKSEILAELRDMRRRRAKYRGASAASKNYSNVLRDVIKTQMELFTGVKVEPDNEPKPVNNISEEYNYKHNYKHDTADNSRDDRHGKHRSEYKTERHEESSHSRDNRSYDIRKEIHHRGDKDKYRQHEKYGDTSSKKDRNTEKYYKKEKETHAKRYDEDENGHSSLKYKDRSKNKEDRRYSDKYTPRSGSYREASETRSERSYKSEKNSESRYRSTKRHREDSFDKYKDATSKKGHRDDSDLKHRRYHDKNR